MGSLPFHLNIDNGACPHLTMIIPFNWRWLHYSQK